MKKVLFLIIFSYIFFVGNVFALEFGDVSIHGFISQGYLRTDKINYLADTKEGTFEFNEMALNFSTILTPGLRAGLQIFSYDLGERGNDEISLDWCYGDYQWQSWLGVRIGAMKTAYGLYNETRDIDILRSGIFLPAGVYPEIVRDDMQSIRGASIYGEISMYFMGDLSYTATIGKHIFTPDKGFAAAAELLLVTEVSQFGYENVQADIIEADAGFVKNIVLKWNTPIIGLVLGTSYYNIDDYYWNAVGEAGELFLSSMTMHNWFGWVYSLQYTWNDLVLTYESYGMVLDYKSRFQYPSIPFVLDSDTRDHQESWYISVTNRFSEYFELGFTYNEYYPDRNDKDGSKINREAEVGAGSAGNRLPDYYAWAKSKTISARFDLTSNWCAKLEYTSTDGQAFYNNAENEESDKEQQWSLYAAKITYMF